MLKELRAGLSLLLLSTLALGIGYPLFVMGVGKTFFPHQANGSLVESEGKIVGSKLIGQSFASDKYFHPRPSAAGGGYDATNSMGSNLAPSAEDLIETLTERAAERRAPEDTRPIPIDLITSSGSGLDPHISVASALFQAPRVAAARNLNPAIVQAMIEKHTEARSFGLSGERRINVLAINMELDSSATEAASNVKP